MFQYPFPFTGSTIYSKLGIKPDSSNEEIEKGKLEFVKKMEVKTDLLKSFLELDAKNKKEITEKEESKLKAYKIQIQEEGLNPLEAKKDLESFEKEILEVTKFDPGKTEQRKEYDMLNPPAVLLRTEYKIPEIFTDRITMLAMVRKDLNQFFEAKNLNVYHPSDLSKDDFSSDFRYNKIVDGEKA